MVVPIGAIQAIDKAWTVDHLSHCDEMDVELNKCANALIHSGSNVADQILGRRYPSGDLDLVLFWHSSLFVGKSCCLFYTFESLSEVLRRGLRGICRHVRAR